jgi:predicted metalloprotease with PDZ domain
MLTGASHVEYGFGVPKKVLRRLPLPYVIIEPTEIEVPPEKQMLNVELPDIHLLPADFVWWVPYEDLDADRPRLGVGIDDRENRLIVQSVTEGSPGQASGIRVGDEITSIAGHPLANVTALVYWVGQQAKGATVTVTVRRDGRPLEISVGF